MVVGSFSNRPRRISWAMVKRAIYETYLHFKGLEREKSLYSINLIYNL
jgi:hypothetical protein